MNFFHILSVYVRIFHLGVQDRKGIQAALDPTTNGSFEIPIYPHLPSI